jgi:Flp pilus assembly protein TadB
MNQASDAGLKAPVQRHSGETTIEGRTVGERSTGELVKLVAEQVSVLVRDEMKLAQLEMTRKGKEAGKGIGMMGGGGLIALYGVACLIACAIIAISLAVPAWLAALIIGAALLVLAAIVAAVGRARMKRATPPMPREAVESIKTDVDTIRESASREKAGR